jgi:hypothetical protein
MKQKKALILFAILINIGSAFGQRGLQNLKEYDYDQYHFGFLLGYNKMGFALKTENSFLNYPFTSTKFEGSSNRTAYIKSAEPKSTPGFTIGIIGNLRLAEHFDLRFIPSLSFGERDIVYDYIITEPSVTPNVTEVDIKSMKSTLLEFPLHLKYKGNRINNARPYILGGIKFTRDLSSDAKKSTTSIADDNFTLKLKQNDLYGEFGAGFDFYFDWFKMGLEAKMSYGFNKLLVRDPSMYTDVIKSLNSKIFQLSLTFE